MWPKDKRASDILIAVIAGVITTALVSAFIWITNSWGAAGVILKASYRIPFWLLVVGATGIVISLVGLVRTYWKPAYVRRYRQDAVDGIIWRWSYDGDNKIIEPTAFCPIHNIRLILRGHTNHLAGGSIMFRTDVSCPSCNLAGKGIHGTAHVAEEHVVPKIEGFITDGSWKVRLRNSEYERMRAAQSGLWQQPTPRPAPLLTPETDN